uniref:Uncharacterized protein n=1 Tax=Chelydra serpentina TaxID=8475 RepID=A0A8C3S3I4_CHESE
SGQLVLRVWLQDVVAGGDVQLWDVLGMVVAQQRAQTQPHGQPDTHTDSCRLPEVLGAPPQEGVHQRDIAVQADAGEEEDGAVHVPIEEGDQGTACVVPKEPVVAQQMIGDLEGQQEDKEQVGTGQVEQEEGGGAFLGLGGQHPESQSIGWQPDHHQRSEF